MKKCVVIINPTSGRNKKLKHLQQMGKILNEYGYDAEILLTQHKGHAIEIIKNIEDADLVISVGGDGTFNEVMTGNFERQERLLLAHIPLGTANDIGAMYGYKKNIVENLKLLLNGRIKNIDICTINGKPFTYCAAFGKLTNVSYETPKTMKKKYGYLAYLIYGLKEIQGKTKLYDIKYKIDNEEYNSKVSFILISNANRIAGINNFYNDVLLDDNKFEVLFCNLITKREIINAIYHLTKSDITNVPGFKFHKVSNLNVEFDKNPSKGWSIDGEEYIGNNLEYKIDIVRDVKLLLPEKNINKLFTNKE